MRASGPLVLVWSSHLASCWLCAHRTVTARMSRLTLHACLARYSQKPKFNSIIWGWEAVTVKPNNCNPSYFYKTVLMAALQVIVECQMKLTIKENKRGEAKVMDSQRPGLNKSKYPD